MDDGMSRDEYRYLTFLFCDLVGSTPLSQELDQEDWRFVLGEFRKTCLDCVRNQGGSVHDCQGDGFLFYFGYPVAYEDSAQRAVWAAMAIVEECQHGLPESTEVLKRYALPRLCVRAGIHSGKVVIGTIDGESTATGFPLAYTARLHSLAEPNRIVISDETRHLVGRHFHLLDKGNARLKGIDKPVAYHEVVSRQQDEKPGRESAAFVGRQHEKSRIRTQWLQAASGQGGTVLVEGDAGIGKSRLIREFIDEVASTDVQVLQWRCLSNARSIALNPLMEGFRRLISEYTDGNEYRRALSPFSLPEAEDWFRLLTDPDHSLHPMLAHASVDTHLNSDSGMSSAEKRKRAVLKGLADRLVTHSQRRPLLLVLEDVHWIDPSTSEFLTLLSGRLDKSAVMLLMSRRCDAAGIWQFPFPRLALQLFRLTQDESCKLIRSMPGSESLSVETINRLVKRSDGVPLFIEESAAMLIDSNGIDSVSLLSVSSPVKKGIEHDVPSRLMDLLTARLDHTGDARQTAGLAACIGRGFSKDLLFAVSESAPEVLDRHLATLLDKGLLQWESGKQQLLAFKHELVRDAAYAILLKSTRRAYHSRIACALESGEHSKSPVEPEILAYHFAEAGMNEHALDCWLLAARRARLNSNPVEATSHYAQIKALLAEWPEDSKPTVASKELEMLTGLGGCHIALQGYGSDDARACFEAAEMVAKRLGKDDKVMRIRFGLEAYYFMRGDFSKAQEISRSCLRMARSELRRTETGDHSDGIARAQLAMAQSLWALGNVYFHKGDFSRSIPLLRQCTELCSHLRNDSIQLADSPNIMSQLYCAWYECETGAMDSALANVERIVEQARAAGHAYTICVALAFNACIHLFRCEYQCAIIRADESIKISAEPGFLTWLAWARVLRGRSLCGDPATMAHGLSEIQQGIELWDSSGAIVTRPFALALQAESFLLDGNVVSAWRSIERSRETMKRSGERYFEAEIYRIKGRLCRARGNYRKAEQYFQGSVAFALERKMSRSVLRSSIELIDLHQHMGVQTSALEMLRKSRAETVGSYGADSDLMAADNLIRALSLRMRI